MKKSFIDIPVGYDGDEENSKRDSTFTYDSLFTSRKSPMAHAFVYSEEYDPAYIHGSWSRVLDTIYNLAFPVLYKAKVFWSGGPTTHFDIRVPKYPLNFRMKQLNGFLALNNSENPYERYRFNRMEDIVRIQKRPMFAIIEGSRWLTKEPKTIVAVYRKVPNAFPRAVSAYLEQLNHK